MSSSLYLIAVPKPPPPPPPPEMEISIVSPLSLKVLPRPMKFSVLASPTETPPDSIPTVSALPPPA